MKAHMQLLLQASLHQQICCTLVWSKYQARLQLLVAFVLRQLPAICCTHTFRTMVFQIPQSFATPLQLSEITNAGWSRQSYLMAHVAGLTTSWPSAHHRLPNIWKLISLQALATWTRWLQWFLRLEQSSPLRSGVPTTSNARFHEPLVILLGVYAQTSRHGGNRDDSQHQQCLIIECN